MCGNATQYFDARLDSFHNFYVQLDTHRLAELGFSHLKENILFCRRCKGLFITWDEEMKFFEEHVNSLCMHEDPEYKFHGSNRHSQSIQQWLSKDEIKSLALDYWRVFNREDMKKLLKVYFWFRGDHSCPTDFRRFIKYLFRNHLPYA